MLSQRPSQINILISLCVFFLISVASAQQLEERVEVQLVQVDLVATDSKGLLVTDLTAEDFTLKENGDVQTIKHFYNSANDQTRFPLAMSFLIDTSFSMHETVAGLTRIDIAVNAAEMVMSGLIADDQIELIEFNNKPDALVPFTSDIALLREKFATLDFQKANTAMHDAVVFALDRVKARTGRKIIVIFSDGMDTASKLVEEDVVDAIRKSDATIVAFFSEVATFGFPGTAGMSGNPNSMTRVRARAGEDILRMYAESSGGQFFSFRKEPELLKAMESFRALIQSQYTLAYTPVSGKKRSGWRKIKVECKRKGVQLRHREGYWAD